MEDVKLIGLQLQETLYFIYILSKTYVYHIVKHNCFLESVLSLSIVIDLNA